MTGFKEIDIYQSDLDRTIASIFHAEPISSQLKYVLDRACGNSGPINKLPGATQRNSLCGRMLEAAPLRLIGVNGSLNKPADAAQQLKCIEHFSVLPNPGWLSLIATEIQSKHCLLRRKNCVGGCSCCRS